MSYKKLIIFCFIIIMAGILFFISLLFLSKTNILFKQQSPHIPISSSLSAAKQEINTFTLPNGLTTIVLKQTTTPQVLVQIVYHVGAANEQYGEKGIAHVVEHMIRKGSKKFAESDIPSITKKFGANANAFTSHDVTSYFFETTKNNWEVFLDIIAESMQNAQFNEQPLASEIKTIFQELKMSTDTERKIAVKKIFSLLFPGNHPYHQAVIGHKDDLFALNSEKLRAFYKKYYHPNNATLFIIGNVDPSLVQQKVTHYFKDIPAGPSIPDVKIPYNERPLQVTNAKIFNNTKQKTLRFFWRIPLNDPKNSILLSFSSILLGDGRLSRLYKTLVEQHHVATNVTSATIKLKHDGILYIAINPLPGKADVCKTLVQQELTTIINKGFSKEELRVANNIKQMNFCSRQENIKEFAYRWVRSYAATRDIYRYFSEVNDYSTLTSQVIQQFIHNYINPFSANSLETIPYPSHLRKKSRIAKKQQDQIDRKKIARFKRTDPVPKPIYLHQTPSPQKVAFSIPTPDIVTKLPNGLNIIIKQKKDSRLIQIQCRLNDAHYLAKTIEGEKVNVMMRVAHEQSPYYTKQQNLQFFRAHGATYSFNRTGATLTMLNHTYKDLLQRFFHILLHPTFPEKQIIKHKKYYKNIVEKKQNNIRNYAQSIFKEIVYANHPFGWTKQEMLSEIAKLNQHDFINLHKQYIAPNNMTIAIVGDIDPHNALSLIEESTKSWMPNAITKHHAQEMTQSNYIKVEKHFATQHNQSSLIIGSPSFISPKDDDYLALEMLNHICFSWFGSKLFALREAQGLFYSAHGRWAKNTFALPGYNILRTATSPYQLETAKNAILNLITTIKENGISAEELDSAKQWYIHNIIKKYATTASMARTFCSLSTTNLGLDHYEKTLKKINALSANHVNEVAKKHFIPESLSILTFGRTP